MPNRLMPHLRPRRRPGSTQSLLRRRRLPNRSERYCLSTTVAYRPFTALTYYILWLSSALSTKCAVLIHYATVVLGDRPRRAFQLHDVALGIAHIDRRPLTFRAIARGNRCRIGAVRPEMGGNRRGVEWLDPQAEMVQVAAFASRCGATLAAERSIDRHQIDQRGAGPKLIQAQVFLNFLHRATQHVAVEMHHGRKIDDPQDHVVQVLDCQHRIAPSNLSVAAALYDHVQTVSGSHGRLGVARLSPRVVPDGRGTFCRSAVLA